MITIAVFNNKGGVGKTTLVYHVACMLAELGVKTLAVDLDPQANLTSAFLDESTLESMWNANSGTILSCVWPIIEGTGDVAAVETREVRENLHLICGNLGLSRFEDQLSESWGKGVGGDPKALRSTSAFHRMIQQAGNTVDAQIALMDVGPNLGAINRSALIAAEHLLIPLAADLYSLQGLRNLGPAVREWKKIWHRATEYAEVSFSLPKGEMSPIGYVVLQHAVRLDRPVKAYQRWLERIPLEYRQSVLNDQLPQLQSEAQDPNCLASLRNYRSLMPLAQDARKPMFDLRAADGALGSHAQYVQTCYDEFRALTGEILLRVAVQL